MAANSSFEQFCGGIFWVGYNVLALCSFTFKVKMNCYKSITKRYSKNKFYVNL